MRYIFTVFLVSICFLASIAQRGTNQRIKIQFQLQSVSTTSGADDPDFWPFTDDPDFFWEVSFTSSHYSPQNHRVGETSSKNVSVGHDFIAARYITYQQLSEMYIATTTGGAEEDGGLTGTDDDPCGPSAWASYYFRDYQPGVNHSITQTCGHFSAVFMLRWDIESTDGKIEVRDNPAASKPFTQYCEGKDVYVSLSGNDNDLSLSSDYEYYWEYHFVGNRTPSTQQCYVRRRRNIGIERSVVGEQAVRLPIDECQPSGDIAYCGSRTYDPSCYECQCDPPRPGNDIWSQLTTSPINNPAFTFRAFKTSGFNNMQLRVSIRKISNASHSSPPSRNSDPTNFFIFDPAPVINNIPTNPDQLIESTGELDYTSPTFDIRHVACFGGATGSIKIKSVTGGGVYKFYLRQEGVQGAQPQSITPTVTPSSTNPVVFAGLKSGTHTLIVENRMSPKVTTNTGDTYGMCYETYTVYIKQPPALSSSFNEVAKANGNPYAISCNGLSDGVITATGSGGVGSYTYGLTGFSGQNSASSVNFSGLSAASSYTLSVTDALGCSASEKTVSNLSQPALLTIGTPHKELFGDANQYNIRCHGGNGAVTIFTTGDTNLARTITVNDSSDDVANDTDPAIFNLPHGEFTIVASYPFGCATSTTVTLTQPPPLSAAFVSAKPPSCVINQGPVDNDGYLEISAGGGIAKNAQPYTMYLAGNAATSLDGQTVRFENLKQGTYDVVVQDRYCTSTLSSPSFTVPVNPTPVTFAAEPVAAEPSCFGYTDGKITVAGKDGAPFATNRYKFYLNDDLRSGEHAATEFSTTIGFPIGQDTHVVKIEDSKGCFETRPVVVGQPQEISVFTSITQNICAGDAGAQIKADFEGGTGDYTVQWRDSASATIVKSAEQVVTTTTLSNRLKGTYTLEVKDAKGCSNKAETAIGEWFQIDKKVIDPLPLVPYVSSKQDALCFDKKDGYVSLGAEGGWSSYRYSIDNENYTTDYEFPGLDSGSYTFYVRDARGCVRSVPQRVDEPALLEASLVSVTDAQCFGFTNGAAQVEVKGGTAPYYVRKDITEVWQKGDSVTNLKEGTYTLLIKDDNNCPQSVQATVNEPTQLDLASTRNKSSTCGSANGEGEVLASGGIEPYQYKWYTGLNDSIRVGTVADSLVADVYRVEVTDKNRCVTSTPVEISDIGGAKISETIVTGATCSYSSDGAIDLTVTEGTLPYKFSWVNTNQATTERATTEDIAALASGNYRVSISDSNQCKLFRTIAVGAPLPLAINTLQKRLPNCFGDSNGLLEVSFDGGNGGYTWQWSTGATGTRLENIGAATYTIALNDSKGCLLNESIVLEDPPKLEIKIDDKTICVGQSFPVDAGVDNATYQWTSANGFSSAARNVVLTAEGAYTIKVIDSKGCPAEDVFTLTTSSDLLKAEFLLANHALAGDTVVVIDISWPMPDGITWQFDSLTSKVVYQGQDYAEIIFNNPGVYEIGMNASLGDCRDIDVQFITIEGGSGNVVGRESSSSYITRFEIFPNPSDGDFAIDIELAEGSPDARLRMINLSGSKVFLNKNFNTRNYVYDASLERVPGGVYFVLLEVGGEKKMKRVVVK